MAKLVALYRKPADTAAFDDYYFNRHVPLAKTIPGVQRYEVSVGGVGAVAGESPYHLAAIIGFAGMNELQGALASPQGQAAAADLANFASAGVELLVFNSRDV